jgi:peptide/nickel transport system permease protein
MAAQQRASMAFEQRPSSLWRDGLRRLRRNRGALVGAGILLCLVAVALFAPQLAPYSPIKQELVIGLQAPSQAHLLGTDEFGRDLLSRIIFGSRVAIQIGFLAAVVALAIGVPLGLAAGFYGGVVDQIIMRTVDVMLGFPYLLLSMVIVAVLGPSLTNAMLAVGIVNVPQYARLVRGSVLAVREREYVLACQALGVSDQRTILRHILPNVLAPIIVQATLGVGQAIINAAGLSFLGMGAQPPAAEWGAMLASGREYILRAPWVGTFPGLSIFITVLGFNLLGDGLRDALDPKMK